MTSLHELAALPVRVHEVPYHLYPWGRRLPVGSPAQRSMPRSIAFFLSFASKVLHGHPWGWEFP